MEYQKYLKYKTKYLQLKAKLTQLGGGAKCYHDRNKVGDINTTQLRNKPNEDSGWVNPPIILQKNEYVEVIKTENDFGLVRTKSDGIGWVRMAYLFNKNKNGDTRTCVLFPRKETIGQTTGQTTGPGGHAAFPSSGTAATSSTVLVPGLTLSAPPVMSMKLPPGSIAGPSSKTAEQKLSSSAVKSSYGCTHDFCRENPDITGVHAILVVKDDNGSSNVLLGRERDGRYVGEYNMFGGSKDPGDCILSCLYREISEEARFLPIDKSINWENFVNIFMDSSGNFYGNRIHHITSAVFVGVIRRGNLFFNAKGTLPVGTQQVYDGNSSKLEKDIRETFGVLISSKVASQYCEMDDVILFNPASPPSNITGYARSNIKHLLGQIQTT